MFFSKRSKLFLGYTFLLTWIMWGLLAYLTHAGITGYQSGFGLPLYILGGSSPTIIAYVAVTLTKKEGSIKEFNARVFSFKHTLAYYLIAIITPIALGACGLAAAYLLAGGSQNFRFEPFFLFVPFFLSSIIFGGIEEFGWRGILQHQLGQKLNLFKANLIIGLIWSLWHLPLYFIAGTSHQGSSFLFFALAGFGFSAFMTWLYAKTKSIMLCVFFHAAINAAATIGLMVPMNDTPGYFYYAAFIFLAGLGFLIVASFHRSEKSKQII
ncbi:MAG: type II CAAX endopeptidase family protein [Bacillota bacterium]|nr:type II CAAX endopeptidase family protein [Bacillota bacterium]